MFADPVRRAAESIHCRLFDEIYGDQRITIAERAMRSAFATIPDDLAVRFTVQHRTEGDRKMVAIRDLQDGDEAEFPAFEKVGQLWWQLGKLFGVDLLGQPKMHPDFAGVAGEMLDRPMVDRPAPDLASA